MKKKKEIISVLLALVMLFSMMVPVFAEDTQTTSLTVSVSSNTVAKGDTVTVTFHLNQSVSDVVAFCFFVEYDSDVFEYDKSASEMPAEYKNGMTGFNELVHTIATTTKTNTYFPGVDFAGIEMMTTRMDYSWLMPEGDVFKLVLRAKSDVTDPSSAINLNAVLNALHVTDQDIPTDVTVNGKPSGMEMSTHQRNGGEDAIQNVEITINETTPTPAGDYSVAVAAAVSPLL